MSTLDEEIAAIRVEAHDEEATTLAGSLADPIQTNTHPAWTDLVSAAAATGIGGHTRAEKDTDESETAYTEAKADNLGNSLMEPTPCAHLNHHPKM
jgi:hypothetical protein